VKPFTQKSDSRPAQAADGKSAVKLSYFGFYCQNVFFFSEISGSVCNQKFQWGKLIVLKLFSIWDIKMEKKNFSPVWLFSAKPKIAAAYDIISRLSCLGYCIQWC